MTSPNIMNSDQLYTSMVAALEVAGQNSPYSADANEEDPRYKGAGKVNAAYIIGGMVIFFWVVGVITRIQGF